MKKIASIIVIFFIISITIFFINIKDSRETLIIDNEDIYFKLKGEEEINIYEGGVYNEPGFVATNEDNEELTDEVVIENNLDTNTIGTYTITYKITINDETYTLTRKINVIEDQLKYIEFRLKGEEYIDLIKEEEFVDPLYTCINKNTNVSCEDKVTIESKVDTKTLGTYTIEYTLKIDDKEKQLTRTVNVIEHPIKNIDFKLKGEKTIELIQNEEFLDPLYTCIDKSTNASCNNQVTIENKLNNQKIGTYTIDYTIKIDGKEKKLTRTINVIEDPIKTVDFKLKGEKTIELIKGDDFTDPLYTCIDKTNNSNCNNQVTIENKLNNQKIGTYTIEYTLKIKDKEKTLTRIINVIENPLKTIEFNLIGDKTIELIQNEEFVDPLYTCIDKTTSTNCNDKVTVTSKLNNKKTGIYTIEYALKIGTKEKILTRTINVVEDPIKNIEFQLNGKSIINLIKNETFTDPLYTCIDKTTNANCSDKVTTSNKVDTKTLGTYTIEYTLKIKNKVKKLTRTINVLNKKYDISLSEENLTNQDVEINFNSYISNFSHIITPDNKTIYNKTTNYTVKSNGTYKFTVYDNEQDYEEYTVKIINIDKTAPTVTSCSSVIKNNKTTFTIKTSATDIKQYEINNSNPITTQEKTFTINSVIENGKLTVYDNANNTTTVNCSSYYEQITPSGSENIKYNVSTNTLKVWIELNKRSGRTDYYTTHIWVKDAYNQFKLQVPDDFGNELVTAKGLIDNAVSQDKLQSKLVVGINASGFVKKGVWGEKYYEANAKFNLTGTSPIILSKGKIIRDLSAETLPASVNKVYGLNKSGNLVYYSYAGGTNTESNIATTNKIKNAGILNTFAFKPVLVYNGTLKSTATDQNIRQGLCQIDKNNFVFITDIYSILRNGFSYQELGNYMLSLGCKTGFNLDGGGSTSLIFKEKNKSSVAIAGNTREIADVIYFQEQ